MNKFIKYAAIIVLVLFIGYLCGPKPSEPNYNNILPDVANINYLPAYVDSIEKKHIVKPGNHAEIIWADSAHQQTEYSVIYLHGFSASKQEGNPIHINFAKAINANLYLARLADHGVDTLAPMQYFAAERLWDSAKEAYAIGKKLGKKVIIVGTSTGGTLAIQLAANYPEINSIMLLSPNIAINSAGATLLNNPWGLQIGRLVTGGRERIVKGKTEEYKKYWYTNYRVESIVQLEELVESTMTKEMFGKVKQPTLLLYYFKNDKEQDDVVKVADMLKMFDELGAVKKEKIALPDVGHHVMGSYITSKDLKAVQNAMLSFYHKSIVR